MGYVKTGNHFVDDAARGKMKRESEESKMKSRAKKAAAAGKSHSRRSRGRAAAGRGGKGGGGIGIVSKKAKGGKSFKGLLNYMLDDSTAKLIASNCGYDKKSMSLFMRTSANANQKIKSPVQHMILALPHGEKKSPEKWAAMVESFLSSTEMADHPYAAVLHKTDKGQDLHICISRVSISGDVLDSKNDFWLMQSACQNLEKKFNLKLVTHDQMKTHKIDTPKVRHSEVKQAERTQAKPPRMVVAGAIKLAKQNKPDPQEFIKRLATAGIVAIPYVHKNEVKGFSFSMDGTSYKGKDVAASWKTLKTEINYEQDRDIKPLTELSAKARSDTHGIEPIAKPVPVAEPVAQPIAERTAGTQNEVQGPSSKVERPAETAKKPSQSQTAKAPRTMGAAVRAPVKNDELDTKIMAHHDLLKKLQMVDGDRRALALELARAIEQRGVFREQLAYLDFIKQNPNKKAKELLREFAPDARVDSIEIPKTMAELQAEMAKLKADQAEMAKLKADQAARDAIMDRANPTPSHVAPSCDQTDYQFPTM